MKNILLLFVKFFKIGLFTFGGGYAMIPMIHDEIVGKMKWIDEKEMTQMIAISESTPGVLAIKTATFAGFKTAGILGAAAATLGVALPSLVIIGIISLFFEEFKNFKYFMYALSGIKAGVVLLIIKAVIQLDKKNKKSLFYYITLIAALAAKAVFKVNAIYILIAAAALGLIYSLILIKFFDKKKNQKKEGGDIDA